MFKHPDNKHLPYVDWRLPENRVEGLLQCIEWRYKNRDLDHYTYNSAYSKATSHNSPTGEPMTREQKIYFSILFGITYQSSMAWTIYWFFPNLEKLDFTLLEQWNNENYSRQQFAKDTKYNKGKFIQTLRQAQELIDKHGSLENWCDSLTSFEEATTSVRELHKVGRMCGWLIVQTLYEFGLNDNLVPKTMLATDRSNWSVRSCLAWIYGREDLMDLDGKRRYTSEDIHFLESKELEILDKVYERTAGITDSRFISPFTVETHLCQMKKILYTGGDAPGTPTQDAYTRWYKLKNVWPEVNYNAYETTFELSTPCVRQTFQNKALMQTGRYTGQFLNMHNDERYPNMYKEFDIDSNLLKSWDTFDSREIKRKFNKYVGELNGIS